MKPLMKKIGCIVLIFAMMITFIPAMSQAAYADEEVTVAGTQQDTDPPEIDTAVMTVSPKTASPGDTVTISVRVTDASEIAEVSLSLRYPDGTEETGVVMQYNEETELYEYAFPVTEDTVDGGYCVYEFDAADENGNETCSNIEAEPLQFTVAGASSEENAPQIDPSQLEVSPAVAAAGDTVRAGVAVTDDTGVSQVLFYYIDPQTGSRAEAYPASRDDSADMWYADIPITESTPTGVWQLDSIYAKDIYNNETELNAPGTGADFTVKKSIAKATVSISGSGSFAYTGAAITPAVTVTDGSATLTKGTDYTVAYANNTNVGTATITITGSGEYAGTVKKAFKITTNCHVKALWASQHNVGSVLFKWTKLPGESVSGWEVHYRTKKIGGGGWSSWTTKSFSAGTMEFRCPVKADYVVEIHARAKGDKSWSQGIITTPAGGKYQAMKYVYVKDAATNKRVDSVTLYVGDTVRLKPDYEYPVADYTKRPRLYPTHALWDLDAAGKAMLTITKPDGSKYTGGLIDGAATFKAVKKGTTTLICRAPNGRTKVLTVTVKPKPDESVPKSINATAAHTYTFNGKISGTDGNGNPCNLETVLASDTAKKVVLRGEIQFTKRYPVGSNTEIDATGATIYSASNGDGCLTNVVDSYNYDAVRNIVIRGGTWKKMDGFEKTMFLFVHGSNIRIEDVKRIECAYNGGHCIELVACKDVIIKNCQELVMIGANPANNEDEPLQLDHASPSTAPSIPAAAKNRHACQNVQITGSTMVGGRGLCAGHGGTDSESQHIYHKNVWIENNKITGVSSEACAMFNVCGLTVTGNTITAKGGSVDKVNSVALHVQIPEKSKAPAEMASSTVLISGNTCTGGRNCILVYSHSDYHSKFGTVKILNNTLYYRGKADSAITTGGWDHKAGKSFDAITSLTVSGNTKIKK